MEILTFGLFGLVFYLIFRNNSKITDVNTRVDRLFQWARKKAEEDAVKESTPPTASKTEIKREVTPPNLKDQHAVPLKKVEQPKLSRNTDSEIKKKAPVIAPAKKEEKSTAFHLKKEEPKDFEKIIGENWLNKIGIAILVVGIGFFVKYAIDKNWITEVGRVAIGILSGGILIGIAHFLRKKYRAFSSVLIGGGISTLYYTITISYHDYQLFTQPVAFGIMMGITLLSTVMSIIYDRRELAIIALLGAFTSPFMVQGENANIIAFFTYIGIINLGMLVLSYFKKWTELSKLSFAFTTLYFGAWYITMSRNVVQDVSIALVFSSIYFIQFLGMNLIYNLKNKIKFNAWEFIQLSSISILYYSCVVFALEQNVVPFHSGLFTVLLAGLFTILSIIAFKRTGTDKALRYLLIGKAITFVTLFAPLTLDGNHMTIFWAIEGVLLMLVGTRFKMKLLIDASLIVNLITAAGLVKNWVFDYQLSSIMEIPIFNSTFITGIIVVTSFVICLFVTSKIKEAELKENQHRIALLTGVFSYLVLLLEFLNQISNIQTYAGQINAIFGFHFILIILAQITGHVLKSNSLKKTMAIISGFGICLYLLLGQANNIAILQEIQNGSLPEWFFYTHYLILAGAVSITGIMMYQLKDLNVSSTFKRFINGFIAVAALLVLTIELDQIGGFLNMGTYALKDIYAHTRAEGYTVLWSLYSFGLMYIGMKKKRKSLRVIALLTFTLAIAKLFTFDIQNISEAGKIIAFISLGILLLIVSFMYQKLKKLIVGEEKQE